MTDRAVMIDTFTRNTVNTWGTSDNGVPWNITDGPPADFYVDGTRGRVIHSVVDSNRHLSFVGNHTNVKLRGTVQISAAVTGNHVISEWLMRTTPSFTDAIVCRVEFRTTGRIFIIIYKLVSGVGTTLGFYDAGSYLSTEDWNFFFELRGSTVRGKLWKASLAEPNAWQISLTQTDVPQSGSIFINSRRENGNTNPNLELRYDSIRITTTIPTLIILPQFLEDYEFKFGHEGLVLNNGAATALPGSPLWDIQKVEGLDLPDVKTSDKEFDGIDGGVLDATNIGMRTIRLEGILYAHEDDSLESYLDQLKANYAPVPRDSSGEFYDPNQKPFFFKVPGLPERFAFAKPIGCTYSWDGNRRFNSTAFQVMLQCQVPTLFSPQLQSVTGDLTGSLNDPTILHIYNAGNYYGYAVLRLTGIGNAPDVRIEHVEQGKVWTAALGTTTSLAGRPVEINMRQRTVYIVDEPTISVRSDVTNEQWWRLAPGVNTLYISSDTSNSGTVEVLWRDEWF